MLVPTMKVTNYTLMLILKMLLRTPPHVAKITPVPGGVGPMTVSKLLENTVLAYKLQARKDTPQETN